MPLSVPKFLTKAFAAAGGKADVPMTGADINNGRADYDNGFPPVTRTPIAAGGIPPYGVDMNGVLFDLSSAIQYLQAGMVFPYSQDLADALGGYDIGAIVSDISDNSIHYKSIIANNTTPPPSVGWDVYGAVNFATQAEFDAHASNDLAVSPLVMQPQLSGVATLTAVDNKIVLPGIVAALGLEKGDVIKISGAGAQNEKLRTAESITDANTIVVNYEHCGGRGNGPLKLGDYSGSITIKRISKWYNAAEGLGQDWVDVKAFRLAGVTYTNNTGRTIQLGIYDTLGAGNNGDLTTTINGSITIGTDETGSVAGRKYLYNFASVVMGGTYSKARVSAQTFVERR